MIKTLITFFLNLKGIVSEPVRATIVRQFCHVLATDLSTANPELAERWMGGGRARFVLDCKITDGCVAVSDDLDVTATDLSRFCDHWLSVTQYREKGGNWTPFTTDMNSVRVTIINGLKELAAKKLDEEA